MHKYRSILLILALFVSGVVVAETSTDVNQFKCAEHQWLCAASEYVSGSTVKPIKNTALKPNLNSTLNLAPQPSPDRKAQIICPATPTASKPTWSWYLCEHQFNNDPYYTYTGLDMPMSYMTPDEASFTPENPARLLVYLHPSDSGAGNFVTGASSFSFSQKHVEIHDVEESYSTNTGGWWGLSGGKAGQVENWNGRRLSASISYVLNQYGDRIDLEKGIHLKGKSLGGTGSILQSISLPDYQGKIAIVEAYIPNMLMVKCCGKSMEGAWSTARQDEMDWRNNQRKAQNIHYFTAGGTNDNLGYFDIEFFELCEVNKISCSGVWLHSGHTVTETGVNLSSKLFMDPNQDVSLDRILPVITQFTGNYHGLERGHHNRGISWNYLGLIDTENNIEMPIKYSALTGMGKDIPDQPSSVTFSVTPRHVKHFKVQAGETVRWVFGDQVGSSVVSADGLITVDGLRLGSGQGYKVLKITG